MIDIPKNHYLYHLSYDLKKGNKRTNDVFLTDFCYEILLIENNNEDVVIRRPVQTTIVFSSLEPFKYWLKRITEIVEVSPIYFCFSEILNVRQSGLIGVLPNPELETNFDTTVSEQRAAYRNIQKIKNDLVTRF